MQNLNNTVTIPKLSLLYRNIFYKNLIFLDIFINLFKHKYVIRSNEKLKGNFERIDRDGNNFYHYTKEITQADLLKLVEEKDYLVVKLSEY